MTLPMSLLGDIFPAEGPEGRMEVGLCLLLLSQSLSSWDPAASPPLGNISAAHSGDCVLV